MVVQEGRKYPAPPRRPAGLSLEQCAQRGGQPAGHGDVPLLGLGGSEKIQNLKKVKIREYIELISQLVGKIGM